MQYNVIRFEKEGLIINVLSEIDATHSEPFILIVLTRPFFSLLYYIFPPSPLKCSPLAHADGNKRTNKESFLLYTSTSLFLRLFYLASSALSPPHLPSLSLSFLLSPFLSLSFPFSPSPSQSTSFPILYFHIQFEACSGHVCPLH